MAEEVKYTEQEEKEWEKKKRTRERVSTLMGQYLLKGYRMLNVNCAECGVRSQAWLFYVRMRTCIYMLGNIISYLQELHKQK